MRSILNVHFENLEESLLNQALKSFYWIRSLDALEKKPSTSELIDWIRALNSGGISSADIISRIPFAGALLKKDKDLENLGKNLR